VYLLGIKISYMKKIAVAFILASGITVVAFGSLTSSGKKATDKKMEKKENKKKKECRRTCIFNI